MRSAQRPIDPETLPVRQISFRPSHSELPVMKPDLEEPWKHYLIDGYALAGCAVLLLYLFSLAF